MCVSLKHDKANVTILGTDSPNHARFARLVIYVTTSNVSEYSIQPFSISCVF